MTQTTATPEGATMFTAAQTVTLVELYRRLIDARATDLPHHTISVYNHKVDITDAEIAGALDTNGGVAGRYENVEITLAECSDYSGASYDRANVRTLRDLAGVESYEATGHHSGSRAWVVLGEMPESIDDVDDFVSHLRSIVEVIEGLDDYPIINESDWSELESELQDEMWDAYVRLDVMSDLDDLGETHGAGDDFDPRDQEDAVRDAYYSFEDNEWTCEDANSATNLRHEDAVAHVGHTVFGWPIVCQAYSCR